MTKTSILEFLPAVTYGGPNIWHRRPVIEQSVNAVGAARQRPCMVDGMLERFFGLLGPVIAHAQTSGQSTRIVERIVQAHSMLEALAMLALELQTIEGMEANFFHTQYDAGDSGRIILEFEEAAIGRESLEIARRCTLAAIEGTPLDVPEQLRNLRNLSERVCLGPSTRAIYRAARRRNIYARRMNIESLVQLGQGKLEGMAFASNEQIEGAVTTILQGIGEDPAREGLLRTPSRVAKMYAELTAGYRIDPVALINDAIFSVDYDEMVLVKDIDFYSMCEHHMLPFMGRVHVAYLPNGKVIGLSKIPRIVEMFARRLQVQERMTVEIADFINQALQPQGVAVVAEGIHMCSVMRGVKKANAKMVTSAMRGRFRSDPRTRAEFMSHIDRAGGHE